MASPGKSESYLISIIASTIGQGSIVFGYFIKGSLNIWMYEYLYILDVSGYLH
jgi:hypothetical protein